MHYCSGIAVPSPGPGKHPSWPPLLQGLPARLNFPEAGYGDDQLLMRQLRQGRGEGLQAR